MICQGHILKPLDWVQLESGRAVGWDAHGDEFTHIDPIPNSGNWFEDRSKGTFSSLDEAKQVAESLYWEYVRGFFA